MHHATISRRACWSSARKCATLWVAAMTMAGVAVSNAAEPKRGESIRVDREVFLQGVTGKPNAIARRPNGELVIAGVRGTAWAVGVDAAGKVRWRFDEPRDSAVKSPYQSEFQGVVPLANGNLLLCGKMSTAENGGGIGLIALLDGDGRLLEQRDWFPNGDRKFFSSTFNRCLPWDGGIALIGTASDGRQGFAWLVKLDATGTKQWEIASLDLAGSHAVETQDHGLVLAEFAAGAEEARFVEVGRNGAIVARRTIKGSGYGLVRSVAPAAGVRVLVFEGARKASLHSLDKGLVDSAMPQAAEPIFVDQGCGYGLPDGSLALFGYLQQGGGAFTAPYSAAVERMSSSGAQESVQVLDAGGGSFTVRDATPVSPTQFVTVRERVSRDPHASGLVISWITF